MTMQARPSPAVSWWPAPDLRLRASRIVCSKSVPPPVLLRRLRSDLSLPALMRRTRRGCSSSRDAWEDDAGVRAAEACTAASCTVASPSEPAAWPGSSACAAAFLAVRRMLQANGSPDELPALGSRTGKLVPERLPCGDESAVCPAEPSSSVDRLAGAAEASSGPSPMSTRPIRLKARRCGASVDFAGDGDAAAGGAPSLVPSGTTSEGMDLIADGDASIGEDAAASTSTPACAASKETRWSLFCVLKDARREG